MLSLVRLPLMRLLFGLGLVFSEVCTPLTTRCLHTPLLYIEGACSLADHINRVCGVAVTVYRSEQGPWRFGRKLDSKDGGERSGRGLPEGTPETHLRVGKARGYPRSYPTGSLALARDSFVGLQRGLGEACALLDTSVKIPKSSTGVCISIAILPSAFILCTLGACILS